MSDETKKVKEHGLDSHSNHEGRSENKIMTMCSLKLSVSACMCCVCACV